MLAGGRGRREGVNGPCSHIIEGLKPQLQHSAADTERERRKRGRWGRCMRVGLWGLMIRKGVLYENGRGERIVCLVFVGH
jgi:hypothetical protein